MPPIAAYSFRRGKEAERLMAIGSRGQQTALDSVLAYTESTQADARLILADIWGSQAHALMLAQQGVVSDADARRILGALNEAKADAQAGKLILDPALEDVHMNVEAYVTRAAGPEAGGKLHTARSRNDQVLTDARIAAREGVLKTERAAVRLASAFLSAAERLGGAVMPGYTHTQHAQPIAFGFWATAYAALFIEDLRRLKEAYRTANRSPLGACALAGCSFPIDRQLTADLLGFDGVETHALAVVSDRSFVLEPLFALTALMTNLSRLSAEIIYGASYEFRLFTLDDRLALGSSIMPQKKNPDIAELARGRTGNLIGGLTGLFASLKGLPLGYHRDLQEDKPPLWAGLDAAASSAEILAETVETMEFHTERMRELVYANFSSATELANFLARERGVPFREAHRLTGGLVASLAERGLDFRDLDACGTYLSERGHAIEAETLAAVLDPQEAVKRNMSEGGTSPASVEAMLTDQRRFLKEHAESILSRESRIESARNRTEKAVERVLNGMSAREALNA